MRNKGISTTMTYIFTALLTLGLTALFWFLLLGYYIDVEAAVVSAEVERHNINLAQVLISSPRIAYSDGEKIYRGILDWEKVNNQLTSGSELLNEIGYPNSIMVISVRNLDTDESKSVSYLGSFPLRGFIWENFLECLQDKVKIRLDMIFRIPPGSPWYPSDIDVCAGTEASKYGTEVRTFPISIRKDNEVHPGILQIALMEVW